jgi:hypothetical protein
MPLSVLGMGRATVLTTYSTLICPPAANEPTGSFASTNCSQPRCDRAFSAGPTKWKLSFCPSQAVGTWEREAKVCSLFVAQQGPPPFPQFPPNHCTLVPKASSNAGFLPSDGLGPAHANVSPGHGGEPGVQGRCRDSKCRDWAGWALTGGSFMGVNVLRTDAVVAGLSVESKSRTET